MDPEAIGLTSKLLKTVLHIAGPFFNSERKLKFVRKPARLMQSLLAALTLGCVPRRVAQYKALLPYLINLL